MFAGTLIKWSYKQVRTYEHYSGDHSVVVAILKQVRGAAIRTTSSRVETVSSLKVF